LGRVFNDHFTFRVDTWTPDGESIVEHVAGVEDYPVALATYRAACQRWPGTPITLRQGCASDRGQPAPARGVIGRQRPPTRPHVAELGFIVLLAITASKAVGVIIDGKPLGSSGGRAASRAALLRARLFLGRFRVR
jgi:hypothetical protein